MFKEIGLINYPVTDLLAAKDWYRSSLGVEPYMDTDTYVGYRVGQLNIGLNPNGHKEGMSGPVIFWNVDNIEQALKKSVNAGATISRASTNGSTNPGIINWP